MSSWELQRCIVVGCVTLVYNWDCHIVFHHIHTSLKMSNLDFKWNSFIVHQAPITPNISMDILTYLLTPQSRVLLENVTVSKLLKKFLAFHETWQFIIVFTRAHHLSLFWARAIKSMTPLPTSWRSILILSSHLCLGLQRGLFPQVSPPKLCMHLSYPPYMLLVLPISFF